MKDVFENNPKLEKCFVTSDGQAFYQEGDAKNYAKSLEDKSVEVVLNPNLIDVNDAEELSDLDKEMSAFEIAENEAAKAKMEADAENEKLEANAKAAAPVENVKPADAPLKVVKDADKKAK